MLWFLALFLRYCSWQPDTHTCLYLEIGTGSLQPLCQSLGFYTLCATSQAPGQGRQVQFLSVGVVSP